jgi:hypothetical protein
MPKVTGPQDQSVREKSLSEAVKAAFEKLSHPEDLLDALPPENVAFNNAEVALKEYGAAQGERILTSRDPEWAKLYQGLMAASDVSPETGVRMSLRAIRVVSPDNENYGSVWNIFHYNIEVLRLQGKTSFITGFFRDALEINNSLRSIAPTNFKGGSAEDENEKRFARNMETLLKKFSPDKLAEFTAGVENITNKGAAEGEKTLTELGNAAFGDKLAEPVEGSLVHNSSSPPASHDLFTSMKAPVDITSSKEPPSPVLPVELQRPGIIPTAQAQVNWDYYLHYLDEYSKQNPQDARHQGIRLLANIPPENISERDILLYHIKGYMEQLYDPKNPQPYQDAAQYFWRTLNKNDPMRETVVALAAQHDIRIDTSGDSFLNQAKPILDSLPPASSSSSPAARR